MGQELSKNELKLAVCEGRTNDVKLAFQHTKLNKKTLYFLLHLASSFGHIELVEMFINAGATNINTIINGKLENTNSKYTHGKNCTPLHLAALFGHSKVVQLILQQQHDANINLTCTLLNNSSNMKIIEENLDCLQCVLKGSGNAQTAEVILASQPSLLEWKDAKTNNSLLHVSSLFLHTNLCRLLITQKRVSVELLNNCRQTPLHLASIGMTKLLSEYIVNFSSNIHEDLQTFGRDKQWEQHMQLLINMGANPCATDHEGYTALHLVCWYFSYYTLTMGFALSAEDYADIFRLSYLYKLHINLGIDEYSKDNNNRTPLDLIRNCIGKKHAQNKIKN